MLDHWFEPIVFFCVLALIVLPAIFRGVRFFRQVRHSRVELIPRKRPQVRIPGPDRPVVVISTGWVTGCRSVCQRDRERWDAFVQRFYKVPPRLPEISVQSLAVSNAQHDFVCTLQASPAMLIAVLQRRAVLLCQEQTGCTWQEAWEAIDELEGAESCSGRASHRHWELA
jgi:hypothetical protein